MQAMSRREPSPHPPLTITSAQNPRVKSLVALRKRGERKAAQVTLVDGYEELSLALESGVRPLTLYYCPALIREQARLALLDRVRALGAELVETSSQVFEKIAYRETPDGWLAVVPLVATDLGRLRVGTAPLILVCESVEKPGNLGAILRTADAAGADAVIAAPAITDWGNPNIIRASKGTVFSVPVAETGTEELIAWLRARDIAIVVTTPDTDLSYAALDLARGVAIVLGSEKHGVSDTWLACADARVRIPMFGRVNSLNVATAAALLTYEVLRQRGRLAGESRRAV
jgi:TrmH family RNA methyltransferase